MRPKIEIEFQRGNKYTKKWIGQAKTENGSVFTLSHNFNGGRFESERDILNCIYKLKDEYDVISVIRTDI